MKASQIAILVALSAVSAQGTSCTTGSFWCPTGQFCERSGAATWLCRPKIPDGHAVGSSDKHGNSCQSNQATSCGYCGAVGPKWGSCTSSWTSSTTGICAAGTECEIHGLHMSTSDCHGRCDPDASRRRRASCGTITSCAAGKYCDFEGSNACRDLIDDESPTSPGCGAAVASLGYSAACCKSGFRTCNICGQKAVAWGQCSSLNNCPAGYECHISGAHVNTLNCHGRCFPAAAGARLYSDIDGITYETFNLLVVAGASIFGLMLLVVIGFAIKRRRGIVNTESPRILENLADNEEEPMLEE